MTEAHAFAAVSPTGKPPANTPWSSAPPVLDLAGKTIAFVWDYLFRGDEMFRVIEPELTARFPDIRIVGYGEFGNIHGSDAAAVLKALPLRLREVGADAAVVAVGC